MAPYEVSAIPDPSEAPPLNEWEGAIGPQSKDESLYYRLQITGESVELIGPSPGMSRTYAIDEFRKLVMVGEWLLATPDSEADVFHTPDGDVEF